MEHNRSVLTTCTLVGCLYWCQPFYRIVAVVDKDCQLTHDKLRRLSATLPDASRLVPPNYDISNRSDPETVVQLMKHIRELKVCVWCVCGVCGVCVVCVVCVCGVCGVYVLIIANVINIFSTLASSESSAEQCSFRDGSHRNYVDQWRRIRISCESDVWL